MWRIWAWVALLCGCTADFAPGFTPGLACSAEGACPVGLRCEPVTDTCVDQRVPPIVGLVVDDYPAEVEAVAPAPALVARLVDAEGRVVAADGGSFALEVAGGDGVVLVGGSVTSAQAGRIEFRGFAFDRPGAQVRLSASGQGLTAASGAFDVGFTRPSVSQLTPPALVTGCVAIDYRLVQAQGKPVDLLVEVDPDGDGPAAYRRATQAGSSPGLAGLVGLPTVPAGRSEVFTWDSSFDVPARDGQASLRFTPRWGELVGEPARLDVLVRNRVDASSGRRRPRCARPGFGPTVSRVTEDYTYPHGALIDHNRDGKLDLLEASGSSLRVALGRGDGSFETLIDFVPAIADFDQLLTADLDVDGLTDVATMYTPPGVITLLFADPDEPGAYVQRVLDLADAVHALYVVDVEPDGFPDLVAVTSRNIQILRQLGATPGNFAPAEIVPGTPELSATCRRNGRVFPGDVQSDGRNELLFYCPGKLHVFHPDPRRVGGFLSPTIQPLDRTALGFGDVVDDERPELVLAEGVADGGALVAYRLLADDELEPVWSARATDEVGPWLWARLVDVGGDPRPEIVYATSGEPFSVISAREHPSGSDVSRRAGLALETLWAVGDVDGDGRVDLIGSEEHALVVAATARRGEPEAGLVLRGLDTFDVLAGDLSGDGRVDLVVNSQAGLRVALHAETAADGFEVLPPSDAGYALTLADLDADGRAELISSQDHLYFRSDDAGALSGECPVQDLSLPAVGDLDGDGFADLVYVRNGEVRMIASPGLTCSASVSLFSTEEVGPSWELELWLVDVDRDGRLDVVGRAGSLYVALQTPEGGFSPLVVSEGLEAELVLDVVDLDLDEQVDVVTWSGSEPGSLRLFLGHGDGRFTPGPLLFSAADMPLSLVDLDDDGGLDVFSGSTARLQAPGGSLAFGEPFPVAALGFGASRPSLVDVDGDGRLDLLHADSGRYVTYLRGR